MCSQPGSHRIDRAAVTVHGIGFITALIWLLEIGDMSQFPSVKHVVSYCGLCSGQDRSAGVQKYSPISKRRNKHRQSQLVEAVTLPPRWNPDLAMVYEREKQRDDYNHATLAVARKLVSYLLAVDRRESVFEIQTVGVQAA